MRLPTRNIRAEIGELRAKLAILTAGRATGLAKYRNDPTGYARDVLGVTLWEPIADALKALLDPPYLVSVDSGHGVGKTFAAAVAVNWWYDTRDPSWVITTAPTQRDVIDLLWTEVRLQRMRAKRPLPDDLQPAAPEMRSNPEHLAKGYTTRNANSAQGRHRPNMLFVFDEKEGVLPPFWDGMKSMFRPGSGDAALVIGNPLTTTSRAYFEHKATDLDGNPKWHRVRLSSLDHPNVAAGLHGQPPPVPGAVTAEQVDQWVADWCDPVPAGDERGSDIRWRGRTYRPGPVGEPRILGLRPSAGTYGVWSEALFAACLSGRATDPPPSVLPVIGCDCARFGDDYTAIHTRAGFVSLRHQAGNGWDIFRIADRLRQEVAWCLEWANRRKDRAAEPWKKNAIAINLDDDATGQDVQVILQREGYNCRGVNAGGGPERADLYPNVRSELWFLAAKRAALGQVNLSLIGHAERQRLEQQLLAPLWAPDEAGRRVVERKDQTKKKLGRSPDDADAMNLAYYDPAGWGVATAITRGDRSRDRL